jgi:hypothetical protein
MQSALDAERMVECGCRRGTKQTFAEKGAINDGESELDGFITAAAHKRVLTHIGFILRC